jgi:hypothetical protein
MPTLLRGNVPRGMPAWAAALRACDAHPTNAAAGPYRFRRPGQVWGRSQNSS